MYRLFRRHRYSALSVSIALAFAAGGAIAQPGPDDAPSGAAQEKTSGNQASKPSKPASNKQLQTVVVTGTRTSGRTEADSISPIQVVSPQELQATGYTDVASALNTLLPSLNFPHQSGDNNIAMRPATLRGLSPDEVLVLVDGVRYHSSGLINYNSDIGRGSSPVDLASLPISMIDHIEVLTDGAAAQYGSDAIAGVINVILKHGGKKGDNSITIGGGTFNRGGGDQNGTSGSVGFDLGGHGKDAKGWLRFAWNYQSQMRGPNMAQFGDQTAADAKANGGYLYERMGEPAVKTYQAAVNFGYDITPDVQLYGYVIGSRRSGTGNSYWRTPDGGRTDTDLYPYGYLAYMTAHTNDFQTVVGLKGKLDDWNWNAYASYGINDINIDVSHTDNISLWKEYGSSPSYFAVGGFRNSNAQANLDLSKDFQFGFLPNPVTVAFGAQARRESYRVVPGDPSSYYGDPEGDPVGAQDYDGLTPSESGMWQRQSLAAYFDLETDFTDKLSGGVAGRYEHYNQGVGGTRSGKISLRYQATDSFALRGTVSNGFRAPSLAQEHYESVTTLISNQELQQYGTYPVSSAQAEALGAKTLRPEKSFNYSLGAVWQPTDAFSATLDLYQIRIWNQILYSDAISLVDADGNYNALGNYFNSVVPGQQVTQAQFFTNAATSRARGAELVANYHLDLDNWGRLDLNADANFNQIRVLSINDSNSVLSEYAPTAKLFGPGSIGLLEKSSPETKYVFGANWHISNWMVMLNETRYGAVTRYPTEDPYPAGILPQTYSARWLTNLSLSYTWQNWTFQVTANNLFNQLPTRVARTNDQYFYNAFPYDSGISPFGMSGGFYYASATFRF